MRLRYKRVGKSGAKLQVSFAYDYGQLWVDVPTVDANASDYVEDEDITRYFLEAVAERERLEKQQQTEESGNEKSKQNIQSTFDGIG